MLYPKLNEPVQIGALKLRTRTAMAPLTRGFADASTGVVSEEIVNYYTRRAEDGIGLIITEGTVISPRGKGIPGVPGIYSQEQIASWRNVTEAVHKAGGTIICQIWHVGRLSNKELTGGFAPQAPSSVPAEGLVSRLKKPYDVPKAMSLSEIKEVIGQYKQAAINAIDAGFDGVEIHGAHGYLIDQFNWELTNQRTDEYGGTLKKRLTFLKEVCTEVVEAIGADRTVIRFSPHKVDDLTYVWEDPEEVVEAMIGVFKEVGMKIIHPSIMDFTHVVANGLTLHQLVRNYWNGFIVGVGGLTPLIAESALEEGTIDVAAFGRPLIPNPDYLHKVNQGEEVEEYEVKKHLGVLV